MFIGIEASELKSPTDDVRCHESGRRDLSGEGDGDAARTGSDIGDPQIGLPLRDAGCSSMPIKDDLNQGFRGSPGNQRRGVDLEGPAEEIGPPNQMLNWFVGCGSGNQSSKPISFGCRCGSFWIGIQIDIGPPDHMNQKHSGHQGRVMYLLPLEMASNPLEKATCRPGIITDWLHFMHVPIVLFNDEQSWMRRYNESV